MKVEIITERNDLVIRRLILESGEPMFWHIDACHRFSVVVRGSRIAIEYKDSKVVLEFEVYPGMAGWEAPEERVHRTINKGNDTYEEVVTSSSRENGSLVTLVRGGSSTRGIKMP